MEHNYRIIAACVCMLGAISLGMGCGADSGPLGVDPSSELDFAAEAIATVAGNSIDAELLALADDIEEVAVVNDADAVFPPPHPPPPKLDRLRTEFDLTDDQVAQIKSIVTTTRDRLKSNFEAVRDGSLTKEEAKTSFGGIRSDTKAQIELVLTAEQLERFPGAADRLTAVATFVPPFPPHRPPPRLDRLRAELNLTDDQVAQIESIVTTTRDLLKPIFEAVRDGSLTKEEAKTSVDGIRSDTKAQIELVLTAEQLERFSELRKQHGRQFNRRRLADFLNLTGDQKAALEIILLARRDELKRIREQVEAGTLTREEAGTLLKALREGERDQIAALLTEEQLEKFESIKRHKRFGFGPKGFGRGPRGEFNRP
jgi:Spy/CpxP family protein refolding chaperone